MQTSQQAKMQGIDTIVALTQNNINANLKFLFGVKDGIETRIKVTIDSADATLDSSIGPPTVSLNVKNQPHTVLFAIPLRQGTFEFWSGYGPRATKKKAVIKPWVENNVTKNWVLAFDVNLDIEDTDRRGLPADVAKEVKNLGAGMFSIRQLFMDFQNADLSSWDKSATQVPKTIEIVDADGKSTSVPFGEDHKSFMEQFMSRYLDQVRENGHHILGYGIKVDNPKVVQPEAPSLPPTDLNFATNVFMPNGVMKQDDLNPGLDTLNFQIMTQKHDFPANVAPWSGNWVTSKDVYGTMAISKAAFIDAYLLPKLAPLTNLKTTLTEKSKDDIDVNASTTKGGDFTITPDGGTYSSSTELWLRRPAEWSKAQTDGRYKLDHKTTVKAHPGTNVITVDVVTNLSCHYKHWNFAGVLAQDYTAYYAIPWNLKLEFSSVKAGALNCSITDVTPKPKFRAEGPYFVKIDPIPSFDWQSDVRALDSLTQILSGLVIDASAAATLAKDIEKALSTTNRFVFPGGQQFKQTNPVFNDECDLLVNLQYEFY